MHAQPHARGGGRVVLFVLGALMAAAVEAAAGVLFPEPLHLTRRVSDPLSEREIVVEEYCAGNRIVTVRGDSTVIVDYERQEVMEIDRGSGTYAITRFEEIAKALPPNADEPQIAAAPRSLGTHRAESGRVVERFEIGGGRIELAVDREIKISSAAIEALIGAAYPYQRTGDYQQMIAAADSALPLEQTMTVDFEGRPVVTRSVITRVGSDLVPPHLAALPPGASRVESRFIATVKLARELDRR